VARRPGDSAREAALALAPYAVRLESEVESIGERDVRLKSPQGAQQLDNDAVVVCAGGVLPTELMRRAGIEFATKYGTA
jgi:hypothetical protein